MKSVPPQSRPPAFRISSPAALAWAFSCLFLLFPPTASRGDIYRWEDSQGTVHFTDDVSTIPPQYRKKSSLLIREAPSVIPSPATSPPGERQPAAPGSGGPSAEDSSPGDAGNEREDLVSRVEALKAKIIAKEQHMSAVDAKRSLATNPLRNRVVDQADLDLYEKYRTELPTDRALLKELESQVESAK